MKKINLKNSLIALCILTVLASTALGEPTISSVSGALSNGGTIIIKGSGFGSKNPAPPLIWADFELGTINPTLLGLKTIWDKMTALEVTSNSQADHSKFSVRGTPKSSSLGKQNPAFSVGSLKAEAIYVFLRRKYDHVNWWNTMAEGSNYKFMRLWPSSETYPNQYVVIMDSTHRLANHNELVGCNSNDGSATKTDGKVEPPALNWNTEEYEFRHSTSPAGNGIFRIWVNSILHLNRTDAVTRDVGSGPCAGATWGQVRIENFYSNFAPPENAYVYMDDIYVDNTWSRVMIGNSNKFDTSTKREIQIPQLWSDNSITITVNQGTLGSFSNVYLYVIDRNGVVNSVGYPLCSSCPNPPTNVKVN